MGRRLYFSANSCERIIHWNEPQSPASHLVSFFWVRIGPVSSYMQAGPIDPNPAFSSLPHIALSRELCTCSRIISGESILPLHSLILHCEPNLSNSLSKPSASRRPSVPTVEAAKLLRQSGFLYSFRSSSEYKATFLPKDIYPPISSVIRSWRNLESV